jgi:hypothetical protein
MSRDYRKLTASPRVTVPVPRWLVLALAALALLLVSLRILQAPVHTLQRLDSPDGRRVALLQRTSYVRDHLRVRVRDGGWWFVPYYSPPFTNNFRVDLGERLAWSEEGRRLDLRIGGCMVWSYDFTADRAINVDPDDAW